MPAVAMALALSLGAASAEPPSWTLADAVAAFLASSPELQLARLRERAAAGELTQAGLRPNPEASLSLGNIPLRANASGSGNGVHFHDNWVGTAGLTQSLELGGKRSRRVAAASERLAVARLSTEEALRLARFEVERAFWQAVLAQAHRQLAEEIQARYQATARIFRARFAADDVAKSDVEKIELEALRQENDLDDARAAEHAALHDLLRLVGPGAPPEVRLRAELPRSPPPLPDLEALRRQAEGRSDLRVAAGQLRAARAALDVARAEAVPDLSVGVTYTHSQAFAAGDNPDVLAFTIGLPLPVFHRNQGEIARASSEVASAETELAAARAGVDREIEAAMARLRAARDKVARYQEGTLARADRALQVAERAHREGAASLLALLEAERTYIALRQDYLDTLFELRVALLEVGRATGAAEPETGS